MNRMPRGFADIVSFVRNKVAASALLLVIVVPGPALAQFNCAGSFYQWSPPNPANAPRICNQLRPKPGPLLYGVASSECNACSEGYEAGRCITLGGTVPPLSACGCVGASAQPTDAAGVTALMLGITDYLLGTSCPRSQFDTGWGYVGTFACDTFQGPTIQGAYLTSDRKGVRFDRMEGPGCTAKRAVHRFGVSRTLGGYECPIGSLLAGSYCVSSTDNTCPVGNPVKPGTGAKVLIESDIARTPSSPLELIRTYNSFGYFQPSAGTHIATAAIDRGGQFGFSWRSNYDRRLFPTKREGSNPVSQSLAGMHRPDGSVQYFKLDGSEALPSPERPAARLVKLATDCPTDQTVACWEYRAQGHEIERYNGNGLLLEIADQVSGQLAQSLTYDALNRLLQVTDANGRKLTFAYQTFGSPYWVSRATAPDGAVVDFSYDSRGRLASATYGGSALPRQYHYEIDDARRWELLTGITSELGVRYATYGYDTDGRVTSTIQAPAISGGTINRYTYDYSGTGANRTTTIVDPLGTSRTLTIELWNDSLRLKAVSQPCASCGSSTLQQRTFDANGFVDLSTDFRGVVTDRDYDVRGLETRRIEAKVVPGGSGTPAGYSGS
jgi:hypothetical protein